IAGPLALKSAKSFSAIHCPLLVNTKPGSGCLRLAVFVGGAVEVRWRFKQVALQTGGASNRWRFKQVARSR
ncbi:MAG: hypothetical protein NTV46_09515, partial [Verrucomicrobia bacterium]|nr:hypothetical protein [Verrucomicrobiota bacterium]